MNSDNAASGNSMAGIQNSSASPVAPSENATVHLLTRSYSPAP